MLSILKRMNWVANYRKCAINIRHSDGEVSTNAELHSSCDEAVKRARLSDITAPPTGSIINVASTGASAI